MKNHTSFSFILKLIDTSSFCKGKFQFLELELTNHEILMCDNITIYYINILNYICRTFVGIYFYCLWHHNHWRVNIAKNIAFKGKSRFVEFSYGCKRKQHSFPLFFKSLSSFHCVIIFYSDSMVMQSKAFYFWCIA